MEEVVMDRKGQRGGKKEENGIFLFENTNDVTYTYKVSIFGKWPLLSETLDNHLSYLIPRVVTFLWAMEI